MLLIDQGRCAGNGESLQIASGIIAHDGDCAVIVVIPDSLLRTSWLIGDENIIGVGRCIVARHP